MSKKRKTHKAVTRRLRRLDVDLRRASMAVQYEVGILGTMLQFLLDSNVSASSPPEAQAISNALLHTFLLAARNLIHFLFSHNPYPDDIIAEDYVDDPEVWRSVEAEVGSDFRDGSLVKFISRRLAHLTWERAGETKPTWGPFPIAWGIAESLVRFVTVAPKERVDRRLVDDVGKLMSGLQGLRDRFGGPSATMGPSGTLLPWSDFDVGLP
jgi:hypothetical protein